MKKNSFYFLLKSLFSVSYFLILRPEIIAQLPHSPHGDLLNFRPASPNAASLGKFGDVPVNYCTGLPSISIPIYSYNNKSRGLHLNVSLDYHSGGLRLEEKASNVGMNWALDAGGVITREIRGGPDEGGEGYSPGYWDGGLLPNIADYQANPNMYGTTTGPANPYFRYNEGMEDSEPDMFTFNFSGRTGKFMIGKNSQVYIVPQQKIQINRSYVNGNINFTIVTEDGVQYIFDQIEKLVVTKNQATYYVSTSWFLTKIIAPFSAGEINFTYSDFSSTYVHKLPQTYYKELCCGTGSLDDHSVVTLGDQNNISYQNKRLTQISFPDGIAINFSYYSSDRCDIAGDKALKQIQITDGIISQTFKLDQSYSFASYSGTEAENMSCAGLTQQDLRLVLHRITEISGTVEKPPYIFEYTNLDPPGIFSYAQDHWGFFNGAYSNSSLLPYDGLANAGVGPTGSVDNANRRTNPAYSIAGSLKKIIYPTGGSTEFTFESNDIPVDQNYPVYNYSDASSTLSGLNPPPQSNVFTLQKPSSITQTEFTFDFSGAGNCVIRASITSLDESVTYAVDLLGPGVGYIKHELLTIPPGQYKFKYLYESSQCSTGMYVVTLKWVDIIQATLGSKEYIGGIRIKKITEYDAINITPFKTREYSYVQQDGQTSSGTIRFRPQYSYYFTEICNGGYFCDPQAPQDQCPGCTGKNGNYRLITSTPLFTLANTFGSPVLYTRVEEKFTGTGIDDNGKIIRTYTGYGTQPSGGFPLDGLSPDFMSFPYITPQPADWLYGLLQTETVKDKNSTTTHETVNSYSLLSNTLSTAIKENFKGIKVYCRQKAYVTWSVDGCCTPGLDQNTFQLNQYFPFSGITYLQSTTETDFGSNGVNLTKTTSYQYDPNYYSVSKIISIDSKGNTVEQRLYYPFNYTIGGVLQELVGANIITPLVSKEIWQQPAGTSSPTKLLGAEINEFAKFNNTIIKPYKLHYLQSNQPLDLSIIGNFDPNQLIRNTTYFKPEIQFDSYDITGNLLTLFKINDHNKSYIWDYNKTFPIALVDNASASDIAYTSFEADGVGNWVFTTSMVINDQTTPSGKKVYQLDDGNYSYPIAKSGLIPSTNYRVSYWSPNGSKNISGTVGNITSGKTVNGWTYYEHNVTGVNNLAITGLGKIDEVRLYPKSAQMTTFWLQPLIGLLGQCDANNYITYFEYDGLRLIRIRDFDKNIVKQFEYHEQLGTSTTPNWQTTGQTRCKPCPANNNYISNVLQNEERDLSPESPTYNQTRWTDVGVSSSCVPQSDWQNTSTPIRCQLNGSNQNTGYQEQEQIDMNPCSATYNQTRWVVVGYNPTVCPPPSGGCNTGNCNGVDRKCINGVCEIGVRKNISSVWQKCLINGLLIFKWKCTWHYCFSDGSSSVNFEECNDTPCTVDGAFCGVE
jgi:hypothetical protein